MFESGLLAALVGAAVLALGILAARRAGMPGKRTGGRTAVPKGRAKSPNTRAETGPHDEGAPPCGYSYLDALVHCGTCVRIMSCQRYLESRTEAAAPPDAFCPFARFLLRLRGAEPGDGYSISLK
jgi:hypothetical protein